MAAPGDISEVSARLLQADEARRRAMIHGDVDGLAALLADDLSWTHSSGATETKTEFIAAIAAGAVRYQALEITDDRVRGDGALIVHDGVLRGRASRAGAEKQLHARFLAVWRQDGDKLALIAWQSTNAIA